MAPEFSSNGGRPAHTTTHPHVANEVTIMLTDQYQNRLAFNVKFLPTNDLSDQYMLPRLLSISWGTLSSTSPVRNHATPAEV